MNRSHILQLVREIYGEQEAPAIQARIDDLLAIPLENLPAGPPRDLTAADALLIAYPDQVQVQGEAPLCTLTDFAVEYAADLVNTIHILPFFPASSDDGFSVTDYATVERAYGDWGDIQRLGQRFGLMFDAVINHASIQSSWFQAFLRNEPAFNDFFVCVPGNPDLASVVRPRTTPLLTDFATPDGIRSIWTTFSADQADLNYRNPEVLLRILGVLCSYVERGARFIRLDAVGYIWKEIGTPCIHLPQAHAIVSLIREVIEAACPHVRLLTETNVGQSDNLLYLGTGRSEAHLAYNFALPPLLLHSFQTGQATTLTNWASDLPRLPEGTSLLNILATHDGIGLNGCRGFLDESEINQLARQIEAAGGHVSRRTSALGASDPYELNINYMDALDAVAEARDEDQVIRRFVTAHAIMLALSGVPAIYFHSLIGSRGWPEGAAATGRARSINREKLAAPRLRAELADASSLRSRVYSGLARLLRARRKCPAFAPSACQVVLRAGSGVLGLLRGDRLGAPQILCVHNVTPQPQSFDCSLWRAALKPGRVVDIISSRSFEFADGMKLELEPYESFWLGIEREEEDTIA